MIAFDATDLAREPLTPSAASEIGREVHEVFERYGLDIDLDAVDEHLQAFVAAIGQTQRRPILRIR